jgi:aspartyl aminopeptidase
MNTVDIGLPQLAMHSSYETAGVKDVDYMINGLTSFYATDIQMLEDGTFELK